MTDTTTRTAPDATTGSTRPGPGRAARRTVAELGRLWRALTSMRTALILLFLLALAAIPGSLLPQENLAPAQVARYITGHPLAGRLLERLDLFNVFGSPWFAAVYVLLFVSLLGCVIPRSRQHLRAMRARPPRAPARLSRLPQSTGWTTAADPGAASAAVASALRGGHWRVDTAGTSVAAEKGFLRETGNLLFHCALVLLLFGVAFGSVFGYQADKLVLTGQGFVNDPAVYDQYSPGRFTTADSLQPFGITLDRFVATYQTDGEPRSFNAYVTTSSRPGVQPRPVDLRVNHPISFGSTNVYLIGHGYALHVVLRNARGQAKFAADVPCIPMDLTDYLSQCVVKAPDTGVTVRGPGGVRVPLQFGVLADLAPTAAFSLTRGLVSTFPALRRPRVVLVAYTGNLGLDSGVPQSVYVLDTAGLRPVAQALLTPGGRGVAPGRTGRRLPDGPLGAVRLPHGFTLQVTGVTNWVSLQVKDDPGKPITLVAAILLIAGLVASLRIRRRRIWARATPTADGHTLLEVGGLARSDPDGFVGEFAKLAARLRTAVPPLDPLDPAPAPPEPPPVTSEE